MPRSVNQNMSSSVNVDDPDDPQFRKAVPVVESLDFPDDPQFRKQINFEYPDDPLFRGSLNFDYPDDPKFRSVTPEVEALKREQEIKDRKIRMYERRLKLLAIEKSKRNVGDL